MDFRKSSGSKSGLSSRALLKQALLNRNLLNQAFLHEAFPREALLNEELCIFLFPAKGKWQLIGEQRKALCLFERQSSIPHFLHPIRGP